MREHTLHHGYVQVPVKLVIDNESSGMETPTTDRRASSNSFRRSNSRRLRESPAEGLAGEE